MCCIVIATDVWHVSSIKIDPYLNVDAGTMAPTEHGEVFVLDDGGEVDLDLGNYERYLNITLTRENNITTGKIYQHVINNERKGTYLGRTVQVVPHITGAIQEWCERVSRIPVDDTMEEPDVCVIELGGTAGDIESMPFIEAMRQLRRNTGRGNFVNIHVTHVPVINDEQKTKPTQQAIKEARMAGLTPDMIACRCIKKLEKSTTDKISNFCQVEPDAVLAVHDCPSTYHVPMLLHSQGVLSTLRTTLDLDRVAKSESLVKKGEAIWNEWTTLATAQDRLFEEVPIVLVGKYTNLHDSYLSVIKALEHAAMHCRKKLKLIWVDASHLETEASHISPALFHKAWHSLCTASGVLVPGGFGGRGTEGMIAAARWARENQTPYLGICLGMQLAVCEFARNVCQMAGATSSEFSSSEDELIISMPEIDQINLGGTMRLGIRETRFQPGSDWSRLRRFYAGSESIMERHRHRFEVNPKHIATLEAAGLNFVGKDDKGERMEIVELKDHPWFVGVQFHPEYLSRVLSPSEPYLGFVAASAGMMDEVLTGILSKQVEEKLVVKGTVNAVKSGTPMTNGTSA